MYLPEYSYYLLILKSSKYVLDCVCVRFEIALSWISRLCIQCFGRCALWELNHITLHNTSSIFHLKLIFVTCFISDLIYNHHHLCNFIPTKVWIKEELNKDLFGFLNGAWCCLGKEINWFKLTGIKSQLMSDLEQNNNTTHNFHNMN